MRSPFLSRRSLLTVDVSRSAEDLIDRERVVGNFNKDANSKIGEFNCSFNIVLQQTPTDCPKRSR
ncbi:hypothetical protein FF011L_48430 [Roseimaritima multifibrata]|uniref:Uncharacterized protein n=1 Tax=Roseimaritima multifibrata TaxID=1930274 RepID=A0A517MMD3_9BACT|nr:hypothetical protein [Roseimaritima multifibrata]QDS96039.1 hypothetical protein FF011L_48430 [Roseimaritima multifibrata]